MANLVTDDDRRTRLPRLSPARGTKPGWWQNPKVMPFLLVAPAVFFELLVHIVPMVAGVVMAFYHLTVYTIRNWSNAPFAGLANFRVSVDISGPVGRGLLDSFLVTVPYTLLVLAFSWVIATAAAVFLSVEFKGRSLLRSLFLLPYALPAFVGIMTWTFMFQKDSGAINHLLVDDLHVLHSGPFWLIGSHAFWAMVVTSVWKTWPFAFIMLLAAVQGVPDELYEAAVMDGAGMVRQFWSITLPQIRQTNLIVVLIVGIGTFNDFNTPFVMFGSAPPKSAEPISMYIYSNAFGQWNFGLGSAMSVLLLVFLAIISFVYLRSTRTGTEAVDA
ncbi:carbohydrate ABC transporter permease [Rugosimonospora africana]|uniref:ABC transporter permease n=1 Tax=Rugosimonospora africana TaxID=556532 RepID=A0A8J3QS17_9ACTN|nr:sugar ABC transporter permease [Rugosimonospora africana]GIH15843.1 ABC transporter permease [Rugosimonospora africana]